jgi:hypothetical protein
MTKFVGVNIALPKSPSAPLSPAAGDTYYNTTDNTAYVYNGTSWIDLAASGGGSGDITDVVAGSGLTGGATSGSATLNVGAGTGITVNADDVAINTATVPLKSDNLGAFATSTSAAIGVGTIELGHASDTTLTRSAAGTLAVEGVDVVTTSGTQTLTNKTLTLPVINNPKIGYTTQATAASTLTLTSASNYYQYFTGTTASQIVALPVTSTLALGQQYEINNNSTQSITVRSSGLNTIATVISGTTYRFTCILTSGTTAASWEYEIVGANAITGTGSLVFGTNSTINNALLDGAGPQINALHANLIATTTSGGTLVLGSTSPIFQRFIGTSNHTVTLASGTGTYPITFFFQNLSSGDITINASNGSNVLTLKPNQQILLHATSVDPTTPSLWDIIYLGAPTYTGTGSSVFATSPSLVAPSLGAATATSINGTTIPSSATLVTTGDTGSVTSTMIANDTIVNADINSAAGIVDTKLATISTAGKVSNSATTATDANTASAIVARNASGNFTAGTITATAVTGLSAPSLSTDAVNKAYVDAFSVGLNWHAAVKAVQTANTSGVYTAGTSGVDGGTGVGAYIEAAANGAISSVNVDGYSSWVLGDRLLYVGNTNAITNGIYKLTNLGSASSKWRFTRATDFDGSSPAAIVMAGDAVYVINGTTYGKSAWAVNSIGTGTNNDIIVGTDNIDFAQFNGAATLTAGAGLLTTGNTIDVVAGTGITTSGDQVSIDSTVATLTGSQTLTNKTLTSPTLTTPVISSIVNTGTLTLPTTTDTLVGQATTDALINKTSYNKVAITAPATSATLTLADGSTLATSGAFSTTLTATATTNATLPSGTTTLAPNVTTTIGDVIYASATSAPGTLARLAGNTAAQPSFLSSTGNGTANTSTAFTSSTGSGNVVLATSPTLTTPSLGAATATSINGTTIPSSATLVTSVTGTGAISSSGGTTPAISIADASTTVKGAVQLEDSVSSTSTTTAATPKNVKTAYEIATAAVPQTRTITSAYPILINGYANAATPLSSDITVSIPEATSTTAGCTIVITAVETINPYPVSSTGIVNYINGLAYATVANLTRALYGSSGFNATHTRQELTTTNTNVSGTLTLTRMYLLTGTSTVTNISVTSGATASSGLTYCAFGIYTRSGTTFTRQRITSSDTTIFNTANTKYTRALTSTLSMSGSTEYWIGVLQVGTTMATTLAATARADTAANAATGVQVYTVTGQTTLGTALTGTAHATRADFAEVS